MTMTMTAPLDSLPDQATLDRQLAKAKGRLFFKKGAGFLGSLLCNHALIWDHSCKTAWCNGETIGFSPAFFSKLPAEGQVTLLAHELWHTGFDHMNRIGDRDPTLWNYAADFVINLMLQNSGFDFTGMNPLLDEQFKDMSTEQVYDLLVDNNFQPPKKLKVLCEGNAGGTPEEQNQGAGEASDSGEDIPDLFGDIRPGASPETVIGKLVQAKQSAIMSKEAGSIPGEIEQIIEEFLSPILPWETLLYRFFEDLSNDDYSWRRPNRRHEDEYLPSLMGENGLEHLAYFFDVSGSVTDKQLNRCHAELKFIHGSLRPKMLTLITFDTKIQDVYEFAQDETFEKITIHGRGGTSLDPVYHWINAKRPTAAIVFSDLYCNPMTADPKVPILWVILDNKSAKTTFGQEIHIRADQI